MHGPYRDQELVLVSHGKRDASGSPPVASLFRFVDSRAKSRETFVLVHRLVEWDNAKVIPYSGGNDESQPITIQCAFP